MAVSGLKRLPKNVDKFSPVQHGFDIQAVFEKMHRKCTVDLGQFDYSTQYTPPGACGFYQVYEAV